jgi:hypothetical protein
MGEERRFEPLDGGTSGAGGVESGKLGRVGRADYPQAAHRKCRKGFGNGAGILRVEAKGFNAEDAKDAEHSGEELGLDAYAMSRALLKLEARTLDHRGHRAAQGKIPTSRAKTREKWAPGCLRDEIKKIGPGRMRPGLRDSCWLMGLCSRCLGR